MRRAASPMAMHLIGEQKALWHMMFSTRSDFCKCSCKDASSAAAHRLIQKTLILWAFSHGSRIGCARGGEGVSTPFPYARTAA